MKKIIRKKNTFTGLYVFIEKKSMHKWTCTIQPILSKGLLYYVIITLESYFQKSWTYICLSAQYHKILNIKSKGIIQLNICKDISHSYPHEHRTSNSLHIPKCSRWVRRCHEWRHMSSDGWLYFRISKWDLGHSRGASLNSESYIGTSLGGERKERKSNSVNKILHFTT